MFKFEFDWLELMQRKNMAYGHYEKSVCANFLHVTNRRKSLAPERSTIKTILRI